MLLSTLCVLGVQALRPMQQQIGFQAQQLVFPNSKRGAQGSDTVAAKRRAERNAAFQSRPIKPPVVAPAGMKQASLMHWFSSQPQQQGQQQQMPVSMDMS